MKLFKKSKPTPPSTSVLIRKLYDFRGAPVVVLSVLALFVLERKYPLRKRKIAQIPRLLTNIQLVPLASLSLRLALVPAIVQAARFSQKKDFGLLRWLPLPPVLSNLLGFMLLDYSNYGWHWLNHRSRFMWRFHQVHHADMDMDVSTGLRFHIGEMLISVFYRAACAALGGVSPRTTIVYEIAFELANNFHHSNTRMPEKFDRGLSRLIVTPRMHGIHHSIVRQETDSNYCIVLTFWDQLHRTFKIDIPQEAINIGVPYVRKHLKAGALMKMPWEEAGKWQLPDGTVPQRVPLSPPSDETEDR
ncbi:sterol desaturase family protein [Catalinimonas sp. 4WD22]|uniref:sterol desaturase family protein n=1 Tax=Catalinimonas locisalis TaxID=3133978 RepID=UPI0031017D73